VPKQHHVVIAVADNADRAAGIVHKGAIISVFVHPIDQQAHCIPLVIGWAMRGDKMFQQQFGAGIGDRRGDSIHPVTPE
jgi:hypothetical protein